MDEIKHGDSEHVHKKKRLEHMRENPWIVSTFVLGILVVIILVGSFFGITGKTISSANIGELAADFVTNQLQVSGTLDSVESVSGIYQINIDINGKLVPLYFTKDGNWIEQGGDLVSILSKQTSSTSNTNTQTQAQNIPKSNKPIVELFIWSYCPYGVQAQGPLVEVVDLLGEYADFKAVMYYGGHGEYEIQQNKIQECIQELYPAKYWKYAAGFVKDVYPACSSTRTVDCDKTESIKLMKSLGIDSTKVLSCVSSKGESLISTASSYASSLGVTGSPTLVINGVKVNAAKSAEAYKGFVCVAFNNAPEECATVLDSESGTASGNC